MTSVLTRNPLDQSSLSLDTLTAGFFLLDSTYPETSRSFVTFIQIERWAAHSRAALHRHKPAQLSVNVGKVSRKLPVPPP